MKKEIQFRITYNKNRFWKSIEEFIKQLLEVKVENDNEIQISKEKLEEV